MVDVEFFERDLIQDSEKRDRSVVRKETKNALWIRINKASIAGPPAIPFEFEGLAEPSHIRAYPAAYEAYLAGKHAPQEVSVVEVIPARELDEPEVVEESAVEDAPEVIEESLGAEI